MLTELRIRGLGVIAETHVEFAPGMTALTGETGAGKTMVVTSLGLLLGARADAGVVRRGSGKCIIEGRFAEAGAIAATVEAAGGELDAGELLVARQIAAEGRSRAFAGGVGVPVSTLAAITGEFATIHGQSEQLRLGTPERQRDVLDRFAGPEHAAVLTEYRQAYAERSALAAELHELKTRAQERAREADLLAFGLGEIRALAPQPGEDESLAAEASRLQSMDDLRMLGERASAALSGDDDNPGALGLLGQARKAMGAATRFDLEAVGLEARLRALLDELADVAASTATWLADLDADPARLEAVAERRYALAGLTRKYGSTIDEVLDWAPAAETRLLGLQQSDERIEAIDARLVAVDNRLTTLAERISLGREAAAEVLHARVGSELKELAMPHARLRFELKPLPSLGPHGGEQVTISFAANPGSEPAPLAKAASGGELSRVRLALEVVLADSDPGHTFVFDEVDAGVGGAVAVELGRRLSRLATRSQVIVVTHLAQVAVFADRHLMVAKSTDGEVTTSGVSQLIDEQRERELARMMSGLQASASSLAHARELIASARESCPADLVSD